VDSILSYGHYMVTVGWKAEEGRKGKLVSVTRGRSDRNLFC
jgi:hypothetical protein